MAIDDLPLPVVNLLNVFGVPWPYINEDTVLKLAGFVRAFRQALVTTHQDATKAVAEIARAHKSASTQKMTSGWANLSAAHVDQISAACTVLADALDAAAGYIVVQKGVAIATMIELAASFFAAQAAAPLTFGGSEVVVPLIGAAARKVGQSLMMDLTQYVAGEVIEKAAKPLFTKIQAALSGLDWSQSGAQAGEPQGFAVNPAAVATQLVLLRSHAAKMRSTAADLAAAVRELKF